MKKATVILTSPNYVNLEPIRSTVKNLILGGYKTNEIGFRLEFTTSDRIAKKISEKFNVLKQDLISPILKLEICKFLN